MEILAEFGRPEQQQRWLVPLLEGEIRSCFSMTEPAVASSDANNIDTRIERAGDEYVITGRKWWSSGALSERCAFAIVTGVTDPEGERHRHTMVIVPLDTPGVRIRRATTVFGYDDGPHGGHAEVEYDGVPKGARVEISAIKVAAPRVALWVLDRAIQAHGGPGVSADFPLASMFACTRILQIADGPDEVHEMALARRELPRHSGPVPVGP